MDPYGFFQCCAREVIAFGAKTQLFGCSAAFEYLAIWSVFAVAASTFSSHVIAARTAI
jgi:hypothetical protein